MEKVGREGSISVEDGKKLEHEIEYVEGLNLDNGYLSPYFVTNPKNMKVEFEDCLVFVTSDKISRPQQILPILEHAMQSGSPLLLIAEDIEGDALQTLISNRLQNSFKVCAVKAPGFGDNRKARLADIATCLGANYFTKDLGMELEEATMSKLDFLIFIIFTIF